MPGCAAMCRLRRDAVCLWTCTTGRVSSRAGAEGLTASDLASLPRNGAFYFGHDHSPNKQRDTISVPPLTCVELIVVLFDVER